MYTNAYKLNIRSVSTQELRMAFEMTPGDSNTNDRLENAL